MPPYYFFPLTALLILFVFVPWLILHYASQMKSQQGLRPEDEKMLEDLWRSARTLNRRVEAIESILEIDAPLTNDKDKKND